MSNYSLQSYKGMATRHTCPNCGDRHSFAYYVDEQDTPLHLSVGRCNHESSCGYHYYPQAIFSRPSRMSHDERFLFWQAKSGTKKQAAIATDIGMLYSNPLCRKVAKRS